MAVNPTEGRRYFMLYNSEIRFVDELIANLKLKGINTIPFDNEDFYNGIANIELYFHSKRNELGSVSNEISLLFIKNPFENIYKRFKDAILLENGSYLSFINPDYAACVLDLTDEDAEYIINKNRSGVSPIFVSTCAEKFCLGANIPITQ